MGEEGRGDGGADGVGEPYAAQIGAGAHGVCERCATQIGAGKDCGTGDTRGIFGAKAVAPSSAADMPEGKVLRMARGALSGRVDGRLADADL